MERQDFEQPFYTYNQQEPKQQQFNVGNYSRAYESGSSSNYNRPQGNKRQSNNNWQNQNPSPPKRFSAHQRINPWQNQDSRQNYVPQNINFKPQAPPKTFSAPPTPLMDMKPSIGQRIKNRYVPPPPRKNFKPSKVTKTKPYPPKKYANQSSEDTKKIISGANKLIAQSNKITSVPPKFTPKQNEGSAAKPKHDDNVLRADKPPSPQMKGRLELALGTILKEIKEKQCTDPGVLEFFMIPFIQRLIKHTLRTRIRNVMMNKVIGSVSDIVDTYCKQYSKETDIELMNVIKDAYNYNSNNRSIGKLVEADTPEEFFQKNMSSIMVPKIDEILRDLKKLYDGKTYNFDECLKHLPFKKPDENRETIDDNKETIDENKTETTDENRPDKKEIKTSTELSSDILDMSEEIGDKMAKIKYYTEFMEKLIEQRLPRILPKFREELIAIMCQDKEFIGLKAMVVTETKRKLETIVKDTIIIDDDGESPSPAKHKKSASQQAAAPKNPVSTSPAISKSSEISEHSATGKTPEKLTMTTASKAIQKSKVIENATSTTSDVSAASAVTSSSCNSITEGMKDSKDTTTAVDPTEMSDKQTSQLPATPNKSGDKNVMIATTPTQKDINYVKLIGRPNLPARAVIYDFLNKFSPASIKKHKSINNLLVIGFTDKEGFEKILAANETTIGDVTVIIKASEQVSTTPVQNKTNVSKVIIPTPKKMQPDANIPIQPKMQKEANTEVENQINQSPNEGPNTTESIIPADLDSQISDLLSSIRKADEKDNTIDAENELGDDEILITESPNENIDTEIEDKISSDFNGETKSNDIDTEIVSSAVSAVTEDPAVPDKPSIKQLETIAETAEEAKKSTANEKTKSVEDATKGTLKDSGRATPTRSSSRLAATTCTPSTIKTRRASKLANN